MLPGLACLVCIPRATVDVLNKEIEASKAALTSERKDRQVLQTKRDHVSKEFNEFKADYGRYMATQSKRVTEGKAEHSRLTEKGTRLQEDLKKDERDMMSKQELLKAAKQDYTTLQKQLKTRLKTLQVSVVFAVVRHEFYFTSFPVLRGT